MVLNVERFTKSLFAYLYQDYKFGHTSEVASGLPSPTRLIMPEDFDFAIGDCVIIINRMLRPYFQPVFEKAGTWACRSERTFLEFIKRRCMKLRIDHTPILFLAVCAVVAELNLFCFQRECFRFSSYAPECLGIVFQSVDEINDSVIDDTDPFAAFGEKTVDGVQCLKEYCKTVLDDIKANPDYIPPHIEVLGKQFKKMKDKPIEEKVKTSATMSSLVEFDEDKPDEEPLIGACGPPTTPDRCKFCKENECSKYFVEFEANFFSYFYC